jgi:membrane protease YdiL (CAAX protease family)
MWLLIFITAVIFMLLHLSKRFSNENNSDYIFSLKDIGVRTLVFTFISIFLYWLVY